MYPVFMRSSGATIRAMFRTLRRLWGPQHWWPAESQFEVIVGAYLTQNTSWTNVERAMTNLRAANALSVAAIREMPLARLEELVRPSGYFRQKAERLKRFVAFLDERYGGSLERMFAEPTAKLREELLALNGVGPETADSILLYAGGHEVFVVDAYTRRVFDRHALLPANAPYEDIRALFEKAFRSSDVARLQQQGAPSSAQPTTRLALRPEVATQEPEAGLAIDPDNFEREKALFGAAHEPSYASEMLRSPRAQAFNEMHAMIVGIGKNYCLKTAPLCEVCPLKKYLPAIPE
jgi:endonuclease-3 related protein